MGLRYKILYFFCCLLFCISCTTSQQNAEYHVGFYNVENFFDTINDPVTRDNDFTPTKSKKWNKARYTQKLENLSRALFYIDSTYGAAVIGLAEVENKAVVKDLINTQRLKNIPYKIIHQDSPDTRGIDVCAIYNSNLFTYKEHHFITVSLNSKTKPSTREILVLQGTIAENPVCFIFSHWPSRAGGKLKSDLDRKQVASMIHLIAKKIHTDTPLSDIVIMGDFNDTPFDENVYKELKADTLKNASTLYYNASYKAALNKEGSYYYKGKFLMLDNAVVLQEMLNDKKIEFSVINPSFLCYKNQKGEYIPNRTFGGKTYFGGYSDHYPIVISVFTK